MCGRQLVFTDLDGSLLDHYDYSFEPAQALLSQLELAGIPVVPVSSKTRAELLPLRGVLKSRHPFIVENGAAVFVPRDYFASSVPATFAKDDFLVWERGFSHQACLEVLAPLRKTFAGEWRGFSDGGVSQVVEMTGLDAGSAQLAGQREYSEPVQWLGSENRQQQFIEQLQRAGAQCIQGGRLLTVGGGADKGSAVKWLHQEYQRQWNTEISSLAVGDGPNDISMLEATDYALLIRSPANNFPILKRRQGVLHSSATGPQGWDQGVRLWLKKINGTHTN